MSTSSTASYSGTAGLEMRGLDNIEALSIKGINAREGLQANDVKIYEVGDGVHRAKALWSVGIPNLGGIHPYLLQVEMVTRQVGIYSSPYLYALP